MATEDRAPWEVIRAAADRLEELAGKATPGPWQACEPWVAGIEYPATVQTVTTAGYPNTDVAGYAVLTEDGMDGGLALGDAAWIATLSPAVAEPLVAWLRASAEAWESYAEGHVDLGLPRNVTEMALAFARRVLGSVDRA